MAAIRTKEELIDRIAKDHVWRLREISELKNLICMETLSQKRKTVLCRAGVALLYAHWEGFIKKTGSYYLEYVSFQRLPASSLKSNFITLMMKNHITQAIETKKFSAFDQFTDFLLTKQANRSKVPYKSVVNTESNLSTKVLKEITWCLGIGYEFFESKEKLIDQKLVGRRNHVAHGEELSINVNDFLEMVAEVLELMNIFRNLVENSAAQESYKRVDLVSLAIHTQSSTQFN